MADINFDWGDQPDSDPESSSSEEDFVSSQSIASAEPDNRINHLPAAPATSGKPQAEVESPPGTAAAADMEPTVIQPRKPTNLLDLPVELLKEIIKEVRMSSPNNQFIIPKRWG